jgi:GDPmannose 4,6-dehydratase
MKKALVTGLSGQDGSYLAELLLDKGYEVHGLVRATSELDRLPLDKRRVEEPRLLRHQADLTDGDRLQALLERIGPDEVYHLGAQSDVRVSFDQPVATGLVTGLSTARLLEAIRSVGPDCRFFSASSAAVFGSPPPPQNEDTPFHPQSPYGAAKAYAHWMTRNYRETYGMFAVNGILFNHESPRRGAGFVTRKITRAAARIKVGLDSEVSLGSLDAVRDWGYAKEYVEGMWRMLQADEPDDCILATGVAHTVRDFAAAAFGHVGLDWERYVRFDEANVRPAATGALVGDASKIAAGVGWKARTLAPELAALMVDADLELATAEAATSR